MKKFFLLVITAGLISSPLLSEAAYQQRRAPASKQPVRCGAHSSTKNGAYQYKKSGAHQAKKSGAHQGPRNGAKPAITAPAKTGEAGVPIQ